MRTCWQAGGRGAVALAILAVLCACGGGGDDVEVTFTPATSANRGGTGWVQIYGDSVPSAPTGMPWVTLKGSAFVTSAYVCCSGNAVSDTGVTVSWKNTTTGESGAARQSFGVDSFGFFYSLTHSWSAQVSLAAGANVITVTASDGNGNWETETVTVTRVSYASSTPSAASAAPAGPAPQPGSGS